MNNVEQDNSFKLIFDGQQHQIDANVLINSLLHTTNIIQEANRYLDSSRKIKIDVKAMEKGSFIVGLSLSDVSAMMGVFADASVGIATVIGLVAGVIQLKKKLKGKRPKKVEDKGDEKVITDSEGNVYTVHCNTFNVYQNKVVQEALAKNFETINEDAAIEGFSVVDSNDKILASVERENFAFMAEVPEEVEYGDKEELVENARLHIVRLSFDNTLKWEFYYNGNKITAKVKDPEFYERIDNGQSFSKGDVLDVTLQIAQKFDKTINTYYNTSYQVVKINHHILREKQVNLF
jgi:hypothetical protein